MAIENYARRLTAVILNLVQPEVETFDPLTRKPCHRIKRPSELYDPLQKCGHSTFSKMAAGRHLGFDPTGSSAIRSVDLENPTLEQKMKRIRLSVAKIWPFEIFQDGSQPPSWIW